jgi:phospholipase/lecithinase/hemolysin
MADIQSLINGIEAAVNPVTPATAPITLAALGPASALQFITLDDVQLPPGGFSTIYSFGDSLSDAGNISLGSLGILPVGDGIYSGGRFTNGNVWVQDLAQNLGLAAPKPSLAGGTDYAYGGAETGPTAIHAANPSDLPSQVGQFVAAVPDPSPTALYTVWAGSNDVLDIANSTQTAAEQQATVQQAVNNEVGSIDGLIAHGAKDLVVMSVPDLGITHTKKRARPAMLHRAPWPRPTTMNWVPRSKQSWRRVQPRSTTSTPMRCWMRRLPAQRPTALPTSPNRSGVAT